MCRHSSARCTTQIRHNGPGGVDLPAAAVGRLPRHRAAQPLPRRGPGASFVLISRKLRGPALLPGTTGFSRHCAPCFGRRSRCDAFFFTVKYVSKVFLRSWASLAGGFPGTALHSLYRDEVQMLLHRHSFVRTAAVDCCSSRTSYLLQQLLQQSNQLPALVHGAQAALMHQRAARAAAQAADPVCFVAMPVPTPEKTADCMSVANARCCACRISPRRSCSWT